MSKRATLYISTVNGGDQDGDQVRLSIQEGLEIVARFELSAGDFLKAVMGRVTPIILISRGEGK